MIYLATPYSHPDPAVRQGRFEAANQMTAVLIEQGHVVFSPISHSHVVAPFLKRKSTDWEFWKLQDLPMLAVCDKLIVMTYDGAWARSIGVLAEIEFAKLNNIETVYIPETPAEYAMIAEYGNPADDFDGPPW